MKIISFLIRIAFQMFGPTKVSYLLWRMNPEIEPKMGAGYSV